MNRRVQVSELRQGTPADLPGVAEVMTAAFDTRFGEGWTTSQCMGMLALPGAWLTIAKDGEQTIGFSLARATLDESELLLIATLPSRRGLGVGRALLRSVITEATERGARSIHLEVRAGNPAIALYMSEGFIKVGERPGYYRGASGKLFDAHSFRRVSEPARID